MIGSEASEYFLEADGDGAMILFSRIIWFAVGLTAMELVLYLTWMKSPYVLLSSRIRFSKLFGDGGGEGGIVCLGLTFSSVIGSGLDGVEIFTEGGSFTFLDEGDEQLQAMKQWKRIRWFENYYTWTKCIWWFIPTFIIWFITS